MSNHTGTMGACQDYAHDPRPESTPSPSHSSSDSIDRRLVQRYGAWLLTGGYTALPTYAWVYYARLGVTEAEMVCIAQLCTYWWSSRDPYPGEAALAARMGKSVRTIQGYLRSLEGKGLLHIHTRLSTNGQQSTNSYDLRPFFAAVEGLARVDGLLPAAGDDATPATAPTTRAHRPHAARDTEARTGGPCDHSDGAQEDAERKSLCAGMERTGPAHTATAGAAAGPCRGEESVEGRVKNPSPQVNPIEIDTFDFDSIPPTPTKTTQTPPDAETRPPASANQDDQPLAAEIAALSDELGDDAPRSSLGRARNLCRDAGVSPARFLRLLDEAAARTRGRQASIVKRQRDGQAPNGMPYLFAVLQDLLHPAPQPSQDITVTHHRGERSGRRRRRLREERAQSSWVGWADTPERLPVTESNQVWHAVLDELTQVLTVENFNTWLASTHVVSQDGELLRIAVPKEFNKQWLEAKLHGHVTHTLERLGYKGWRVEYVVVVAA